MIRAERPGERPQPVGIGDGEVGMLCEAQHLVHRVLALGGRLQREPFVEHQRVALEPIVERVERGLALARVERNQHSQRTLPVGHVVGAIELRLGAPGAAAFIARRQQAESDGAQPPNALGARGQIVSGDSVRPMRGKQRVA